MGDCIGCSPCLTSCRSHCNTAPKCIQALSAWVDMPNTIVNVEIKVGGTSSTVTTTTDSNGVFIVQSSDFPSGFFSPYRGSYIITVYDTSGNRICFKDCCGKFIACYSFEVGYNTSGCNLFTINTPCKPIEEFNLCADTLPTLGIAFINPPLIAII